MVMETGGVENSTVVSIGAGSCHSLAIIQFSGADQERKVLTWGRGEDGQLGHGDGGNESRVPKVVKALDGKSPTCVLGGAEYSMAICDEGKSVYSWGWGDFGRLGHGDGFDVNVPKQISFLTNVASVSCGDAHTLVVLQDGKLMGFGRNQNGQIGNNSTVDRSECTEVHGLDDEHVVASSCGAEHSLCVTASGSVYAWGWGRYGNLGTDSFSDEHLPQKMKGLDGLKIMMAVCGWRHSVLVDSEGLLYATGWGKYGQLGAGDTENRAVPIQVPVPNKDKVLHIDGGWRHTAAATATKFYCWGWNKWGQLGIGRQGDVCVPNEVEGLQQPISLIACGWRHTLAVTAAGEVYSWGRNCNGQLGVGTIEDRLSPQRVASLCKGEINLEAIQQQASKAVCAATPAWETCAMVPGTEEVADKRQRVL